MKRFHSQLLLLACLVFLASVLPVVVFAQPEIQEKRQEFKDRVERFHRAVNQPARKLDTFELRKDVLLRAIDSLVKHAELTQERLAHFPVVQDEIRTSVQAEIAFDIASLQDFKQRVQAATALEELRGLANELQTHRKDTIEEKIRKTMVLAQVELFEQRTLKTASARAALIQETLPDVPELDALLADANLKIKETSLLLQALKEDMRAKEINDTTMREARSTLKTATNTMREVYKIFRAITFW